MDGPLVSVVLPTRNRRQLLPRSLRSVLTQQGPDLECIVVDDGSIDGTSEWLTSIDDPRLVIARLDGRGAPAARNRGIELARGRYIAFQDSDDEWLPDKLARQLAAFDRSPRPAVVVTGMWIDEGGRRRSDVVDLGDDAFTRLLGYAGPLTTPGIVVDRQAVGSELHFDEALPAMQEHDLMLRLSRDHQVAVVPEPMYVRYLHGGERITNSGRQADARRRLLVKYADDLASRPDAAAYHHWRLAVAERQSGDARAAQASIRRAAALKPTVRFRALAAAGRLGAIPGEATWRILDAFDRLRKRGLDRDLSGWREPTPPR